MTKIPYKWARAGDVNAFFGLMLDNIAGLVLTVSLLFFDFGFPVEFALAYMVPGTAIGVLVGDMLYFWMAFGLAKKENRSDVCAMPLGLDTPSTIGMIYFVLGPAFSMKLAALAESANLKLDVVKAQIADGTATTELATQFSQIQFDAAMHAWHIGICALLITGLIKFVFSFFSNWLKNAFPRAGLLGSLAAIALALIAFIQFQKLCASPIVGLASMGIILFTLIARGKLPGRVPGALAAVAIGCALHYLLRGVEGMTELTLVPAAEPLGGAVSITAWFEVFTFQWVGAFGDSLAFLPYVVPFAIATTIGGIDCAESAASAGDDFDTRKVIGVEAFATMVASLCGGVVQNTPYIGHPAYKAMGGRAAYVLATALFVGGAGLLGYFKYIFVFIPEAAVLPVLVFIGLEITGQSFIATPRRHYAALALAFIPALAKLIMIYLDQFLGVLVNPLELPGAIGNPRLEFVYLLLRMLAGGFIISSLIWAAALAKMIDRKLSGAAFYFVIAGLLTLFGVIHSPLPGEEMFFPWANNLTGSGNASIVIQFAVAYFVVAGILFGLGIAMRDTLTPINTDEEFESLHN